MIYEETNGGIEQPNLSFEELKAAAEQGALGSESSAEKQTIVCQPEIKSERWSPQRLYDTICFIVQQRPDIANKEFQRQQLKKDSGYSLKAIDQYWKKAESQHRENGAIETKAIVEYGSDT